MNVAAVDSVVTSIYRPSHSPTSKRKRVPRRYRLPKAAKAIAWGTPDPQFGRSLCAMVEGYTPRPNTVRLAIAWGLVVAVCFVAMAAGAAIHHRGSDERTDVSYGHL